MRFYQGQHRFYAGIDLQARTMHVCILDAQGQGVFDPNLAASPDAFLQAIQPFRDDLGIGGECMFAWYGLADRCQEQQIAFVLGHALYLKAIHGGKAKNDRIDAGQRARIRRGGTFPIAYVYPKGLREARALLRRRTYLVRQRAAAITHIQIANSQYNLPPFSKKLVYARTRDELKVLDRFTDPSLRKNGGLDLALVDCLDALIAEAELYLVRTAKVEDPQACHRLQTAPGIGKVLALVLLDESHDLRRFAAAGDFLSSARLVRCPHESAGKVVGSGGHQIGNAHLRWACSEAACLLIRSGPAVQAWHRRREQKRGTKRALARRAARLGRTVYGMLRRGQAFDLQRFLGR